MAFHHSIIFQYIRNFIFDLYWLRVLGFFGESYSRLLYLIALVVIINELIISLLYMRFWPEKKCGVLRNVSTILIVGDPQILGEKTEYWFARWDCDRFLRNSFGAALRYSQPDIIIFLGDLMEEGKLADDEQFSRYVSRFKWIFHRGNIPTILVPGYCDFRLSRSHVERFEKFFDPLADLERFENLEFYKVRKLTKSYPNISNIPDNSSTVRIALNNLPLLGSPSRLKEKVLMNLRPQLIFSASHKSLYVGGDVETGEVTSIENLDSLIPKWKFQNKKMLTKEIVVPTCSYRMGQQKIGYGLAMIDKEGLFSCYMILWFPQRLHQLAIYLCLTVLISIYLFVPFLFRYCKYFIRKLTSYINNRLV